MFFFNFPYVCIRRSGAVGGGQSIRTDSMGFDSYRTCGVLALRFQVAVVTVRRESYAYRAPRKLSVWCTAYLPSLTCFPAVGFFLFCGMG